MPRPLPEFCDCAEGGYQPHFPHERNDAPAQYADVDQQLLADYPELRCVVVPQLLCDGTCSACPKVSPLIEQADGIQRCTGDGEVHCICNDNQEGDHHG